MKKDFQTGKLKSKGSGAEPKLFDVDRGGVKPLERDGKPAPENRPDSALVHGDYNINIYANRKALLRELFGVTNNLVHSGLTILVRLYHPRKPCQYLVCG